MNNNSRIYPVLNFREYTIAIRHNEEYAYARYHPNFVKVINHKGHARNVRKKTGFNEVITGDVFYTKLYWVKKYTTHTYGIKQSDLEGMAILRNNELIWYSMPGTHEGYGHREVLVEKIQKYKKVGTFVLESILQKADTYNR